MSRMLTGSIDLTKLSDLVRSNHPAVVVGKNGKKYLNLTIWVNEEADKYGNNASISVYDKETKKSEYFGNLKDFTIAQNEQLSVSNEHPEDDLPF